MNAEYAFDAACRYSNSCIFPFHAVILNVNSTFSALPCLTRPSQQTRTENGNQCPRLDQCGTWWSKWDWEGKGSCAPGAIPDCFKRCDSKGSIREHVSQSIHDETWPPSQYFCEPYSYVSKTHKKIRVVVAHIKIKATHGFSDSVDALGLQSDGLAWIWGWRCWYVSRRCGPSLSAPSRHV